MPGPLRWKKSSRCVVSGACVEIAGTELRTIVVRDAEIGRASAVLLMSATEWKDFVVRVKSGALDC